MSDTETLALKLRGESTRGCTCIFGGEGFHFGECPAIARIYAAAALTAATARADREAQRADEAVAELRAVINERDAIQSELAKWRNGFKRKRTP